MDFDFTRKTAVVKKDLLYKSSATTILKSDKCLEIKSNKKSALSLKKISADISDDDDDNYKIESLPSSKTSSTEIMPVKINSFKKDEFKLHTPLNIEPISQSTTSSLSVDFTGKTVAEFDAFASYMKDFEKKKPEKLTVKEISNLQSQKQPIINITKNEKPDIQAVCSQTLSSTFFNDTQVIKELDTIMAKAEEIPKAQLSVDHISTKRKIHEIDENCGDFKIPKLTIQDCNIEQNIKTQINAKISNTISDLLVLNDLDQIFSEIETSIYQLGNENTANAKSLLNDQVIDVIFEANEEIVNLDLNESSLKNINWNEDFTTTGVNASFSSAFKNALLANASKNVNLTLTNNPNFSLAEVNCTFTELGSYYGLPLKVKELVKQYKGIDELYGWQDECLKLPAIKEKSNLVYALPTSGGKTLVAEILMFREVLCYQKNALFILPYVAIVQEKVWSLSPFAVALDFLVEEYAGGKGTYPPRKRRRRHSVYIATIEKALGLINSLIETDRLSELGLIVVDELHLMGETGRGPTLEALLTKLIYLKAKIQIVGMSATIGNIQEVCTFLDSQSYTKDFRPVELTEYLKCGDEVAKINWGETDEEKLLTAERTVNFNYAESIKALDPDQLGGLVMEVIPKGSCLIFCSSKKNCENVAKLLSRILFKTLKDYKKNEKEQLVSSLVAETGSLCEVLKFSLPFGIAYHHSGLTTEERRVIEDGFRAGIISVICCTSTLAAGVNLPAKRVILRQPYIGRDFINLSRYKQMVGRAGRAGLDEAGDSILICTPQDLPKVKNLLYSPMDKTISSLHEEDGRGLRHLLLSCIALGIANTRTELQQVTKTTLWYHQNQHGEIDFKKFTDKVIKELFVLGALQTSNLNVNKNNDAIPNLSLRLETTLNTEESVKSTESETSVSNRHRIVVSKNTKLVISKLGLAAIKGGLHLSRAHMLYQDLIQAQSSLVLLDALHLLYLVTPYDLAEQIKPNMTCYYTIFSQLKPTELQTAKVLNITESVAVKMLSNQPIKAVPERVLNRFYLTLLLYDLWNEMPIFEAADKYQLNRGLVQNLMQSSATFTSNVVNFCLELEEFWPFAHLLKGMSIRLSHCCVRELVPLMELPAVKQSRAKQLYQAGFKTLQSIAKANADDLVRDIEFLPRRVANQLIAASKMLLLEKVENLREEAEDVLNGVDNPKQLNMTVMK